jgi:hypothetical protein
MIHSPLNWVAEAPVIQKAIKCYESTGGDVHTLAGKVVVLSFFLTPKPAAIYLSHLQICCTSVPCDEPRESKTIMRLYNKYNWGKA